MGYSQVLEPTEQNALLRLLIVDPDENPLQEKVDLVAHSDGKIYSSKSGDDGIASILVPAGDSYTLNMRNEPNYNAFEVPKLPYYTLNLKIYYRSGNNIPPGTTPVRLIIVTSAGDSLADEKVYINEDAGTRSYSGITDPEGILEINLPVNASYTVEFNNAPNYERFELPTDADYIFELVIEFDGSKRRKVYPTLDKALIDFTYLDLDDNPVANDTFLINEIGGDFQFMGLTDENGKVLTHVPSGKKYNLSTTVHYNFDSIVIPGEEKRQTVKFTFRGISSVEYYKRIRLREKQLRERDSIFKVRQARLKYNSLSYEEKKEWKRNQILEDAKSTKIALETNPEYFVEKHYTVDAVLYRNRDLWKNQIIVTDVTCSMDYYLDQVLLWHAMKLMIDQDNEYIFFNDGDGKQLNEKIMGKTGGLHHTDHIEFDSILTTAFYAKSFGCSGDGPENDFEAILAAQDLNRSGKEIILIADNLSAVRDYEMLKLINVPVRIIVCGVTDHVNEQYLDLAYHTKGSVHSLEDDLFLMTPLAEGKSIKFYGKEYVFSRGKFIFKE